MCPKTWGSAELLLDKEVHVSCEPVFFGRRSSSKGWKVAFPTVVHILRCQSCFALMWKEQTQTEGERSECPRRPAVAVVVTSSVKRWGGASSGLEGRWENWKGKRSAQIVDFFLALPPT